MSKNNKTSGMGFTGVLTTVFVALKLTGNIDWSWWWVISPIWLHGLFLVTVTSLYAIYLIFKK